MNSICPSAARPGQERPHRHGRHGVHKKRWPGRLPQQFGLAASEARYMVERGDWNGAAELQARPGPFNQTMAITHFARALGAARAGRPDAAKADIAKLVELRDKLREARDPIGRRSSTFSARSRPHGCSRPRARTTMPSRR